MLFDLLPLFMFLSMLGLILTGYPIGIALGGTAILFGFVGMSLEVFDFREFFIFVPRVWTIAENLQIIAVPLFVFMGVMLERSRIAQDLLEAFQVLLRRVPGGMALAVTLMGVVFAAITGVIGASVIMLTLIALPTMLKAGYRPSLAVGTIAASSTLGILIPPSILLVFLSELLQISVGYLFAGAIYPGLLLASLYMIYIIGYTFFVPGAAPRLSGPEHKLPTSEFISVMVKGIIPPVILIFIIMGSVLSGLATITESAAFGAGGACLLAWFRGNLGFGKLRESLQRSAMTVGMVFVLFIGATSFAYVFRALGGDDIVLWLIDAFDYGPWSVLGLVIFLIFLLGFFFDVLEILLIAMPIFGPIIAPLEFPGHILTSDVIYWFAILVAVTLQTSFLTPPMGIALFYIKGVAPDSVKMRDIYVGIIPFVALQMICVGIVMAFPDLVMDLPHRLLD